ncbi:MAG: RnfABCDGE type electron transport complex subunit B [bacterium]
MVITAIISFGLTALFLGILLSLANKFFAVRDDPKVESILGCLPGVNCGACGYPGCNGYAVAVAGGEAEVNRCTVGGNETAKTIAGIMGVDAKAAEKCVARLFCQGGKSKSSEKFEYRGIISCQALNIVSGGNKSCSYGCLGMGDCVRVCPFGALYMNEDKLPVVIEEKCTACGRCVQTCPRTLYELLPAAKRVVIACRSFDKGADTRKACKVGCIACKRCEKACPENAITVENNLAKINYSICKNTAACVGVCPQKTIMKFPPL